MKPTPQFSKTGNRRDSIASRKSAAFPLIDFNFKPNSLEDFSDHCAGKRFPSFRGISDDYFRNEARKHFISEAAIFALIAVTVAVPIFQAVRGLFELVF